MVSGWVDVRERREVEQQWARREDSSRGQARDRTRWRAGEFGAAVAGGSAAEGKEQQYMRVAVYGRHAVSSCLKSSLSLRAGERPGTAEHVAERVRLSNKPAQLEAPPAQP